VSRLKINWGKFELVSIGFVLEVEELAFILGWIVSKLPMKYLGLPLGARFKSHEIWDPILEKMEKRLVGWKKI
jgi:hypothetical protein